MKTKIYKISLPGHNDLIYIGSTQQTLKQRLWDHKSDYRRFNEGTHSRVSSYDIIKKSQEEDIVPCIELLEEVDHDTQAELLDREMHYINQFPSSLNKIRTGASCKHYLKYKDSKREKIVCSCGSTYSRDYKSKHVKTKKHMRYLQSLDDK